MFLLIRRSLVLQADMAQGLSNNCCATTSNGCGQLKRQKALVSTYENVNKLEGEWKMNKRGTKRRCRLSSSSTPFLLVVGPQYRKEEEEGRPGSSSFSSTQILHARSNGVYFAAAATAATKTFPPSYFLLLPENERGCTRPKCGCCWTGPAVS
uniref:Secreted protein n=1 Tax=Acrobeloides nanus TaxID=290746 RepID=A0A914EM67_9BILA